MDEIDKNKNQTKVENASEIEIEILFNQVMTYFNFRRKIDKLLESGSFKKDKKLDDSKPQNKENEIKIYQNEFCLIDKIWINKWKKYIRYNDIIKLISKNKIDKNDFNDIKSIIENHFNKYFLPPLNMSEIYKNGKLDINSNFDIFYYKLTKLFFPQNIIENQLILKCYPIQFFKNKYIICLDDDTFQTNFKEENTNLFFEILIILKEVNKNKSKLIKELENEDINVWLQKINFKITSDIEKDIIIYDCKITISNKTLKLKKELTTQKNNNALNLQNSLMNFNNNDKISNENNKGEKGIHEKISSNLNNEKIIQNNTNNISSNNLNGNEIIQLEDELKKKLNDEIIKNKKLDEENKDLKESLNKINQNHLNEMNKIKSELDKYKKKKKN